MVGLFFNKKNNSNKKLSNREVRNALFRISGLDKSEREIVADTIESEDDWGGITEFELKRALRKLERNHAISRGQVKTIKERLFG